MTYLGYQSMQDGDITVFTTGMQYDGSVCGVDSGVEDLPYLYYVRTDLTGVCVESCPDETSLTNYICLPDSAIPDDVDTSSKASLVDNGDGYCMFEYESKAILGRCVFSDTDVLSEFFSDNDYAEMAEEAISDIKTTKHLCLGFGIGMAAVLGFIYLYLVRIPWIMNILVWGSILVIQAALAGLGYLMYAQAQTWTEDGTHSSNAIYALYGCACIFGVLAVLWLCAICFLRKQIELAEDIVEEAARPVTAMPAMFLWPLLQTAATLVFVAFFFVYLMYEASTGMATTTDDEGYEHRAFDFTTEQKYKMLFLVFELFWTTQFIVAVGQIALALAIAQWYFVHDKSEIGTGTFVVAVFEASWFHMGTAAFGSLILAVILSIRAFLAYCEKKAKASHNKVAEAVICACQCCFWCLEKCVRFVNKNAYIETAVRSTGFCASCVESFKLVARNVLRLGAVTVIADAVLLIMQAFIVLVTVFGAYEYLDYKYASELNSVVAPLVLVAVLAWAVATQFKEIFGMSILTILHCFVVDEETFPAGKRFAEHALADWLNKFGEKGEKAKLIVN